ncbi:LysE/ArgO family amino acid transporter [Cellulomonas sp. KRMCY2]|uniref:LysE/ArgO family amino acid transporter n=1 Tax=Cellulomonas sp. KRMCY2 TaxID=1304865 RepID=UPI00045E827E|nr:LysE/ArgO family amino acid transporter [Cellulomonas sp. KRMCY2]
MSALLPGFLTGLSLIAAIGAQNAFVLRQGVRREHVLMVVTVCALADAALIGTGIAGLGVLVDDHPTALVVARYGGAAFLLTLAARAALRTRRPSGLDAAQGATVGRGAVLVTTLALTFLNPHVYLDTVVLLGSVANQHGTGGRWAFGAGAVVASILWFFGLGFGARLLRPLFARPVAWQVLDGVVAVVMTVVAIGLVV